MGINMLVSGLVCFIFAFFPSAASASQQADPQSAIRGGGALAFLIAYLARKRPIGGWLFLYYWNVYSGFLLTFIMTAFSLGNLNPSLWQDRTQYIAVLASVIITSVAVIFYSVVSTMLLFNKYRNLTWISLLKKALLAGLIVSVLSLGLDFIYSFNDSMPLDIIGLIGAAIWYAYIARSQRVYHVFVARDFEVWYRVSRTAAQMVR